MAAGEDAQVWIYVKTGARKDGTARWGRYTPASFGRYLTAARYGADEAADTYLAAEGPLGDRGRVYALRDPDGQWVWVDAARGRLAKRRTPARKKRPTPAKKRRPHR